MTDIARLRALLEGATQRPFGIASSASTLFAWDNAEHTRWHALYDLEDRSHANRDLRQEVTDAALIVEAVNALPGMLAELEGLRAALEQADHWILDRSSYIPTAIDHACAECVPGGPIVRATFICVVHAAEARAALDAPKEGVGVHGPTGCGTDTFSRVAANGWGT